MLSKNQLKGLNQSIAKNCKDIRNMLKNGCEEMAFVKYESVRDVLFDIGLQFEFDKVLSDFLTGAGLTATQIEAFKASYCGYTRDKIEVKTITLNK
jgi:hypothetical protein